jgi:hypothetical protein
MRLRFRDNRGLTMPRLRVIFVPVEQDDRRLARISRTPEGRQVVGELEAAGRASSLRPSRPCAPSWPTWNPPPRMANSSAGYVARG